MQILNGKQTRANINLSKYMTNSLVGTYDIWIYKITATLYDSDSRPWRSDLQCIYSLMWSSLSVINGRSSAFFLYTTGFSRPILRYDITGKKRLKVPKGVIRSRISKDRKYNVQTKKTINDLLNSTQKIKE